MTTNSTEKIQLLDGQYYDKAELIKKMYNDSFYYGECSKTMLSSTAVGQLLTSAKTYHYCTKYKEEKPSESYDIGGLVHLQILEPEKYDNTIFIKDKSYSQGYYKAMEEHGKVYLEKHKPMAERIADAFFKNERALQCIQDSTFEVPMVGTIKGIPFRAKADILKNKGGIVDLKTTTSIRKFQYSADKFNYCAQAYIYCTLFGISYEDYKFAVIDKNSLDIGIFPISKEFYERGKERVEQAIQVYEIFYIHGEDINQYIFEETL